VASPTGQRRLGGALADHQLRQILLASAFVGATWGSLLVGIAALAAHIHKSTTAPVMVALVSIGSILGGFLYARCAQSREGAAQLYRRRILILCCLTQLPLAFTHSLTAAFACSVIAGSSFAAILGNQYTLIGEAVGDRGAVEAFTWHNALFGGGVSLGTAVAGIVVSGSYTNVFFLGASTSLIAALTADRLRRTPRRSLLGRVRRRHMREVEPALGMMGERQDSKNAAGSPSQGRAAST
jgi:hypothetical protein